MRRPQPQWASKAMASPKLAVGGTWLKPLATRTGRRVRGLGFRLRAAAQRHGIALIYHRIAEPGSDPWDLAVSPANFDAHLEVARRHGRCVQLGQFAEQVAARSGPRRTIAFTFDDGYRDNFLVGARALAAHDVPATMFVVSGAVGAGRDFWWDALARVFLTMPHLPETLAMEAAGRQHVWHLGPAADCTAAEMRTLAGWRMERDGARHLRQTLFLSVWRVLIDLPTAAAEACCEQVMAWAGADRSGPVSDHVMSAAEIAALASGGLIEIGGHTKTHLALDTADRATAVHEIAGCRADLAAITGREIASFAYPFGRFTAETARLVREAGFTSACNSNRQLGFPDMDRFHIPRITVPNLDGDQFADLLHRISGP
jgi:peptidoglycan/xylan/chitin deacetylase (PgdA/CDA1 family)